MSLYNQSISIMEVSSNEEDDFFVAGEADTSTVMHNCSKSKPGSFMEEKLNTLIDSFSRCTGPPLNGNIIYRMQPSNAGLFMRCMQTAQSLAFTTSIKDIDTSERFNNAVSKLQKKVKCLAKNSTDWPRLVELLNTPFSFNNSDKLTSTLTAAKAWNNLELEDYGNTSTIEGSSKDVTSSVDMELSSKLQKKVKCLAKNSTNWPRLVEHLNTPFSFNNSDKLTSTLTAAKAWNNLELEEYGNTSTIEGSSKDVTSSVDMELSSKRINEPNNNPGFVIVVSSKKKNEPNVALKGEINTRPLVVASPLTPEVDASFSACEHVTVIGETNCSSSAKGKLLIKTNSCSRCFVSSLELHRTRKTVRELKKKWRTLDLPRIESLQQTVKDKSIEIKELKNKLEKKSHKEDRDKNEKIVASTRKNISAFKKLNAKVQTAMQRFGKESQKIMLEMESKKKENQTEIENLKAEIAKIVSENRVIEEETDIFIDKLHSEFYS